MPVRYERQTAVFEGVATIEEAESLLDWVRLPSGDGERAGFDFSDCVHLHAANLQVLIAAKAQVAAWPKDEGFCTWLRAALGPIQEKAICR